MDNGHTYLTLIDIKVLNHESFLGISEVALKQIISRDSFCAAEVYNFTCVNEKCTVISQCQVDIFRAVSAWSKSNPNLDVQPILSEIRLSLFTINDLLKVQAFVPSVLKIYFPGPLYMKDKKVFQGCSANRSYAGGRSS